MSNQSSISLLLCDVAFGMWCSELKIQSYLLAGRPNKSLNFCEPGFSYHLCADPFFFFFFWCQSEHMEIPKLGIEMYLHSDPNCSSGILFFFTVAPRAYGNSWARSQTAAAAANLPTAIATQDLSCISILCCSLWQCWILNTLSKARDWTPILMETMLGP